jgi:hypothetical protein
LERWLEAVFFSLGRGEREEEESRRERQKENRRESVCVSCWREKKSANQVVSKKESRNTTDALNTKTSM